eukprot:TRINITY_DN63905_c1_g1_i1.p1 TRINITY_DN63905_c1_g1~~TRINITY_DN63905_c1_g1_i1.p1  ORF type:complete len:378 (+),score=47.24 TRINITY_DN63905_c1_g1_i1:30-1163(+)
MAQSKQDSRYAFIVDYDDVQAGITRKYQLLYFLNDNTIEMHDIKNRRVFLKRGPYPSLSYHDLYIGATVVLYSRKLRVSEYGDDFTRRVFQKRSEATLGIIKPDGYEKFGEILKVANREGLRVKSMNMVQLSNEEAAHFYREQQGQTHYRELITHMTSYPIIALHLVGEDCIAKWKRAAGTGDPRAATPGSLRSRYGTSIVQDCCYASPDAQTAEEDVDFFFGPKSTVVKRNNAAMSNCSLCLIKPHAVTAGLAGDIITCILEDGFEISAASALHLDTHDAEDFAEVYKGVIPEYQQMIEQITSGVCWALEVRSENAVQSFRQFCGPHDPEIARVLQPNSLRAKFGTDKVKNAVHCTDLPEDGVLEVEFFFRIMNEA